MTMKNIIYDDTEIVKLRVSEFSHGKLEAGRNELGLCTARDESKSCCCVYSQGLVRLSRGVRRRFVLGSREIFTRAIPT